MADYTNEDHEAIFRSILDIDAIQGRVARLMDDFKAVKVPDPAGPTGEYKKDEELDGPDPKDKGNPDEWVPRNKWMNRLTGIHPFNVEAPVSLLRRHGFLTPPSVHYVRNHGLVPKLSWHEHTIDISGLVDRPMKLSMAELVKLPTITVPVTLQCAGNRRKEQNIIQKGIGFNWGCAAASTCIWTGVPLRALMQHVGMKSKEEGANWLNFAGPKGEVPQGDTTYGASHAREACMNPARPCMLAFMMNGELLHPDHGYPVRLLMPGYIGGRMIKWLTTITVTAEEGTNHYHIYDNRVFPKHIVSKDEATKHKIWADPAYTINDRNINSAIWAPAHCEKVKLSQSTFRVGGYAYNGAGRPIHRVEVTLNDGHTWMPAAITRFERPSEYGLAYCWVHWHLDVPVSSLRQCGEFAVRAWDDSQNCQPELPNWNLMGMMNNNWFRVKVHDVPAGGAIWFEHPTRVEPNLDHYWDKERRDQGVLYLTPEGKLPSPGWMERLKDMVVKAHAPLPLEQQPLDGLEHAERALDVKRGTARPAASVAALAQKPAVGGVELCEAARSGGGTVANGSVKLTGKIDREYYNQRFGTEARTVKSKVLVIGGQFSGTFCARELKKQFDVTVVDAKEYFEYTPGVLRAFVKPCHLDALTFTLQPVLERKMGVKFIWGEVKSLDGINNTACVKTMFAGTLDEIAFDYCIICSGCNFGPFKPKGESLWFPTVHEEGRAVSDWPHIDERFIEGRRRHVLEEFHKITDLNKKCATILVVGAGFIGVEWVTELQYFFPKLKLTIIDFLARCLGPLPDSAAHYCQEYMEGVKIKEFYNTKYDAKSRDFWAKIELPEGATETYVCIGVKASNYFMPAEVLSDKGPGGGGWIHFNKHLQVVKKPTADGGAVWGSGCVYAVGDCNLGCIGEPPNFEMPPIPKISYPGEEQAFHACVNIKKMELAKKRGRQPKLMNTWWPWGAGMFATSLGPHDACFVLAANDKKGSGYMVNKWIFAALQKELIETTKINECKDIFIGRWIWHFVHHTPVNLWGKGPCCMCCV